MKKNWEITLKDLRAKYLADPAAGWTQECQTQIHSGGKPKLRVKYKKQGRNYMSYD